MLDHLLCVTVVAVHALCHQSDAQSEPQDEIFQGHNVVCRLLGVGHFCEKLFPFIAQLLLDLVLAAVDGIHRPPQFRVGDHPPFAWSDITVVEIL